MKTATTIPITPITYLRCGRCGRTEEYYQAISRKWLVKMVDRRRGWLRIRCPECRPRTS